MSDFIARLKGRGPRGEYWIVFGGVMVVAIGLNALLGASIWSSLVFPIWLYAAIRRLHDMNRSGWWSLIPFSLGFLWGMAIAVLGALNMISGVSFIMVGSMVINLLSLAFMIAIGCFPGTAGPNRFGLRRGQTDVADVF